MFYRIRHFFHQCGFSRLWLSYDHTTLSFSYRRNQIHDSHSCFFRGCFKTQTLIRENRGQILESLSSAGLIRRISVDCADIQQSTKFFTLGFDPFITTDNIACFQIETTNLRRSHIYIIVTRQIILTTDKSVSVRHNFQNTISLLSAVQRCLILTDFRQFFFRLFFRIIRTSGIIHSSALRTFSALINTFSALMLRFFRFVFCLRMLYTL